MLRMTGDITGISRCGVLYRNQRLEPYGLTYRQADMLLRICNTPGVSQDDLVKRMVLNKSNVARQLAVLEEDGFVERRTCEKDKRVSRIYPLEKTRALEPEIRRIFREWNDYLMEALTPEQQAELKELLTVLRGRADEWMEAHRNG